MSVSIGGLFAALDIGVFFELPDRRFEPAGDLPAWCREFIGRPNGPVALDEKFLFLESFLADAREHWARRSIEALRSGPWTECDPAGAERRLEASALFFAERPTLLIKSIGEEFERARKILQKARETTLAHQRLSLLAAALEAADRETRQALAAHPDVMFRVRSDGSCLDFSDAAGGRTLDPRDILGAAAAGDLIKRARRSLTLGAPLTCETPVDTGARTRWIETRLAPCGTDEALVVVRDVTERKAAEEEIERRLARLRANRDDLLSILDELGVAAVVTAADGRPAFATAAARAMLSLGEENVAGRAWRDLAFLAPADAGILAETAAKPASLREKVRLKPRGPHGARVVEVEVRDDPRDRRRRVAFFRDVTEVESLRRKLDERARFGELIGGSAAMREVYRLIEQLAASDATVLIEGATGSGKELVARALHDRGARRGRSFVAVNCAGLTESLAAGLLFGHKRGSFTGALRDQKGFFEAADGGTLFLDEVGDLPNAVQTALLRALQEREILRLGETAPRKVDVRVVCATHRDLAREVREGRFRSDLLYRVRVGRIRLPDLAERREDIPVLAEAFLTEFRASTGRPADGFAPETLRLMLRYPWPGNVRELRAAVEFAVICARRPLIRPEDLPPEIERGERLEPLGIPETGDERERFKRALEQSGGNRAKAARLLGVSRATFYRRWNKLDGPLGNG